MGAGRSKSKNVTTNDIARLSGVSRSTVSAVLNGKRSVRESTRQKVLECIRQQNYESSLIARSLVGELSRMVAVLASNLGSPYQMMYFRGVNHVLGKAGYHVLFHDVRPEDQEDPGTLESLHAYRPAGYIILKGAEGPHSVHAKRIVAEGIPLVCEAPVKDVETHIVSFNGRTGMKLATDYVIAQGHRKLGHLAGPGFSQGAKERKIGFMESLIEHDIDVADALILEAGETATEGYIVGLEMLKDPHSRPTAVLCFNDMVAMGVYRAAHELSLEIPNDVSVVGFDGIDFGELFGPPLTSVNIFATELGKRAAELLLRVIRNETGRGTVLETLEPELAVRNSVRPL